MFPIVAFAQGGSNYSSIGLGDIRRSVGALYDGMAGTSIAMPSDHGINTVNPALLGMSTYTRLQVGYRFNQHLITDANGSLKQNNGEIDGLMVLFAIDTAHGFGISFGLLPYSSVNYLVSRQFSNDIDGTILTGRSNQSGVGGTSSVQLGVSGRIGNLYGGVSMQSLLGVITLADDIYVSGIREQVRTSSSYDVRGLLFRAGMYYKATNSLSIGGFISGGPSGTLITGSRATAVLAGSPYYDSVLIVRSSTGLPLGLGLGASIRDGRSMYGIDLEWTDHSRVTVNPRSDATFQRSLRATIGYNLPAAHYAPTFWERWGFRAGIGYQRDYFSFKGADLNEYFGSAGFDFPLGQSATVDVALQAGYRAPSSTGLNEYIIRLTATFSIGEIWFRPFAHE